jgi:hypothetical protein
VRPDERDMRNWHGVREPPAIAPYRESVLGGQVRRPPRDVDRFNNMGRGDYYAGRVPFHREREAIESNGGRPVGRSQLVDRQDGNPKRGGDFRSIRPGGGPDIKRAERDQALGLSGTNRARELNNDSVRDWQTRRDRDNRNDTSSRPGSNLSTPTPRSVERNRDRDDARDRVRSMPAEESSNIRRNDHMQRVPSNGYQQNGSGFYRPPAPSNDSARVRDREPSRSSGGNLNRVEPRQYSQPRSEPRTYTPPPPRQEQPRSQPQPSRASPPSNNNNGGGGGNGGGNRGGNRPWSTPKER